MISLGRFGRMGVLLIGAAAACVSGALGTGGALAQSDTLTAKAAEASSIARGARDGSVSVIVEFRQPAAASAAGSSAAAVTSAIHAMQDRILAESLGRASASGAGRGVQRMDVSPMFAFTGTLTEVEALAGHPDVVRIHVNRVNEPNLAQSVPVVGMTAAAMASFTGTNNIVAVIDTGVMKTHSFLAGKVVSEACYSSAGAAGANSFCPGGAASSTAANSALNCPMSFNEQCAHGTHVAGIAAGKRASGSPRRGVAPGAQIIAIQVFSRFPNSRLAAYDSDIIKGLERVSAIRNNFGARKIAAVNMSLGGGAFISACTTSPYRTIITTLRNQGIATVISAGNSGSPVSVSSPGCVPEAITVGSTTDAASPAISPFSSRGALIDIFAPGSDITSSVPTREGSTTTFKPYDGTSMAAPHIAGAFAALRQAFPAASVDDIEAALEGKGIALADPLTGIDKPRLRVDLARPGVTQPLLLVKDDSPVVISGNQGSGPFGPSTISRALLTSNGTARFALLGKPNFLSATPLTGTARGTALNLVFKPVGNLAARPYGVFAGAMTLDNRGTAQTDPKIYATLLALAPASRNDGFGGIVVPGRTVPGSNAGATTQAGEPTVQFTTNPNNNDYNVAFGATVWWRTTFASAGVKVADTLGSDFDTVLCAYRGSRVNALTLVACNDYFLSGDYNPSQITFDAVAGQPYYFQVSGYKPSAAAAPLTGRYLLNVSP